MDVDNMISLAALLVVAVGLLGGAVWKMVTRSEDKLREDVKAVQGAVKAAQKENTDAHAGIVDRLEAGFKEVNRNHQAGFREINNNFISRANVALIPK